MKVTPNRLRHSLKYKVDITVATVAERDAIPLYRRRWMMVVGVYDDGVNNGLYILEKGNDYKSDNDNWERLSSVTYEHPTGFTDKPEEELSGGQVISQIKVNDEGHVTDVIVREIGVGLEWNSTTVPYKTNTTLLDLSTIAEDKVASFYICVTALFGVKHEAPAKKVSMVATRISEFAVHEDYNGGVHGAHVKTQHTGVYAKYGSEWTNTPDTLAVKADDIKIMVDGTNIVVYHKFDKGENIEPALSCKYRIDLQTLSFE